MDADKAGLPRPHEKAAQEAVAEAVRVRCPKTHYAGVARQVPGLLQRHGLGQTLAYLLMRGGGNAGSPYDLIGRQLDRWVLQATNASGKGLLAVLSTRDSRYYLEASAQAWLFARALRDGVEVSQ